MAFSIATIITAVVLGSAKDSFAEQAKYTELRSIRAVVPNEDFGATVDFEATVTYVDENGEFLFVQDGDDAIFVHRPEAHSVVAGQRVRVEGSLNKGDLLPIVSATNVTFVSTEDLPTPRKISDIKLEHDCRYLTFEFEVLLTRVNVTHTLLFAKTGSNKNVCIQVEHPFGHSYPNVSKLAGNCVQCTGVLGLQIAGGAFREPGKDENIIVGYKVLCNSFDNIKLMEEEGQCAYDAQAQMVGLPLLAGNTFPDGRFLTFAQVCQIDYSQPPSFVLCDGSTFKRFQLESTDNLEPGMLMRIGGNKVTDEFGQTKFKVDYLRYLGVAELPKPKVTSIESVLEARSPDQRVTIEGEPLRIHDKGDPYNLILGDGESTIAVHFQTAALDTLASLDPSIAKKVKISGVTEFDEDHGFQLTVGRADDVQLVQRRTSWTRMFAIGFGVLTLLCGLAALWIRMLRGQVAQKRRFEFIFDNAGTPIVVFNGNLKIVDANQFAADVTLYSKDELCKMSLPDIDKNISVMGIKDKLLKIMTTQEVAVFPTQIYTKDNKCLDVEVHTRNLNSSDDPDSAMYIAVFPDTTERLKYENELKEARDEAINANKAKSDFVASMSHELRTPLNGVMGMTQLLENTDLTPAQADYLAACRTSGETLLTVIGDVLDFSKMEAGKLELEPQATKLIPFIENIVCATSLEQGTRHVDLASFVDPRLSRSVMVDCNRLRQVIFNLISNAAKFTSKGSIIVTAKCNAVTDQYADIRFVVADTGIGIPNDRIAGLFEPFEQFDSSTTRQFGGTGLGLTICKQIVELMDGQISVQSTQGLGSDFIVEVRLPFASQENEDSDEDCDGEGGFEFIPTGQRVAVVGMSKEISKLLDQLFKNYNVNASFFSETSLLPLGEFEMVLLNNKGESESVGKFIQGQPTLSADEAPTVIPVVPANCVIPLRQWKNVGAAPPILKPFTQTRLLQPVNSQQERVENQKADRVFADLRPNRALRVLICEDNKVNQMFAKQICRKADIQVVICENGKSGIETLQVDDKFDAIFMDCHMPIMDGYEATRKIRDMIEAGMVTKIPIIALTANALADDRSKCLEAGMDDYLAKPFEIDDFLEKILFHSKGTCKRSLRKDQETISLEPIFNFQELLKQFDDKEFVLDLADQFSSTFPEYRTDLQVCLQEQDAKQLYAVAHRLKGSSGTVKADRINALALEIESAGRAGQLEQLETQIAEILLEFDNFVKVVDGQANDVEAQQTDYPSNSL